MRFNFKGWFNQYSHRFKNLLFLAGIVIVVSLLMEALHFSESVSNDDAPFNQSFKIFAVPLPDTMSFAGERVPMNHLGVREALEQEMLQNTYMEYQSLLMLKRVHRYFPVIEEILKKNNIPDDFKYLALAESAFSYKVSPAGAVGFWQMMRPTAEAYGLEITKELDERYNLVKSTEAACRYFKDAYRDMHNWTLVAASYNMGMAGLEKELEKEKENNYYDLALNLETDRYVYRILALKQFVSYPALYGYYLKKKDFYPPIPSYTVTVDSTINSLADFAQQKGISYHVLKFLNPWLTNSRLDNPLGHAYTITLPKTEVQFAELGEYMNYGDNVAEQATAQAKDTTTHILIHVILAGETLDSVAKQYNVPIGQLRVWNNLPDTLRLKPRDEIMIFESPK
jgi:membrane-bound lytic murein transglycosylase D